MGQNSLDNHIWTGFHGDRCAGGHPFLVQAGSVTFASVEHVQELHPSVHFTPAYPTQFGCAGTSCDGGETCDKNIIISLVYKTKLKLEYLHGQNDRDKATKCKQLPLTCLTNTHNHCIHRGNLSQGC